MISHPPSLEMIFIMGLCDLSATKSFLAFKVVEYATDAYKADKNVTQLSVIAFNSAKTVAVSNCTFNWTTVAIIGATSVGKNLNDASTYISNCHDNTDGWTYTKGEDKTELKMTTSTAKYEDFLKFDTVNIYYNNTLYYSINPTNAATVGFTPLTFFAGSKTTAYNWDSTTDKFNYVTSVLTDVNKGAFSTVKAQLFIAKFQGDYSYLTGTVIDAKGVVACKLLFTSLNEAVCKLRNSATTPTAEDFFLVLKNAAGNVVLKHAFARTFTAGTAVSQTVERTPISWTIPPAPPATDSKSNPVLTTSFVISLKDNSTKTLDLTEDKTCPLVNYVIQSNGSSVVSGNNEATAAATALK